MEHDHGSEYRLRIVLTDGKETLTAWQDQDQIAAAIAAHSEGGKWLQVRSVLCPSCPDREPPVHEFPVASTASARLRPHDSRYLIATGMRDPNQVR